MLSSIGSVYPEQGWGVWWHEGLVFAIVKSQYHFCHQDGLQFFLVTLLGLAGGTYLSGFPKHYCISCVPLLEVPCPHSQKEQSKTTICYQIHFSFPASLWFSFMNLSHLSTLTSNPSLNHYFPQYFSFSYPWDLLSIWFRGLCRVGEGTQAFSPTGISYWDVFSSPHQSPLETQKPQLSRGYIHIWIHPSVPLTLAFIKSNLFMRTREAQFIRQLTQSVTQHPWGVTVGIFLVLQTMSDGHTLLRVLPGSARPVSNHCSVEASSRKSYWRATKNLCTAWCKPQVRQQRKFHCSGNVSQPQKSQLLALCTQPEGWADKWIRVSSPQQEQLRRCFLSQLLPQSGENTRIVVSKAGFSKLDSEGIRE